MVDIERIVERVKSSFSSVGRVDWVFTESVTPLDGGRVFLVVVVAEGTVEARNRAAEALLHE